LDQGKIGQLADQGENGQWVDRVETSDDPGIIGIKEDREWPTPIVDQGWVNMMTGFMKAMAMAMAMDMVLQEYDNMDAMDLCLCNRSWKKGSWMDICQFASVDHYRSVTWLLCIYR
jgi:hypothetical protein